MSVIEEENTAFRSDRSPGQRRFGPVPLAALLGTTTGALVALSVLLVLAIGWFTASWNTQDLSVERFNLKLAMLENQISDELEPARAQIGSVSRLLTSGLVDPSDRKA